MTTARDVIRQTLQGRIFLSESEANASADEIIAALLSAPDLDPHLELAAKLNPELERLQKIEAAAIAWRRNLEDDHWRKEQIESDDGFCRPGIGELFKLLPAPRSEDKP